MIFKSQTPTFRICITAVHGKSYPKDIQTRPIWAIRVDCTRDKNLTRHDIDKPSPGSDFGLDVLRSARWHLSCTLCHQSHEKPRGQLSPCPADESVAFIQKGKDLEIRNQRAAGQKMAYIVGFRMQTFARLVVVHSVAFRLSGLDLNAITAYLCI